MGSRGVGIGWAMAALAAGFLCVSAGSALALEPGVHVDPGSPAAKEYALPLNQARDTGTSSTRSSEGTLFGAGIKPPSSGGSSKSHPGSGRRGTGGAQVTPSAQGGSAGGSAGGEHVLGHITLRPAASSGSDGSTLALLGGAIAIVVLGGFGGTVLRHSRRPS
jgi:hypothetical protein